MRFTVYPLFSILALAFAILLLGDSGVVFAGAHSVPDPFEFIALDTIPPLKDRFGNFVDDPVHNPVDLQDPAGVRRNIEYDPVTDSYIFTERIGNESFRMPSYMTFDEYLEWSGKQEQDEYWKQLAGVSSASRSSGGKVDPVSIQDISKDIIDRLFGGTEVDIRPQGNVDLTFGVDFYRQDNPTLLERQRRRGGFDFDMDIQVNVDGKIGEKLNTSFNYNTKSTFDFENKLKLNYDSHQFSNDAIIQKIEAGDVSLPLRGSLIQGSQSLFGIKTELQFGHLRLTAIASQQRSQKNDIVIQGGSVLQEFEVPIDQYVENRHFFISHFNREMFEMALMNLPQINSLFRITRMEVWVTNDKNQTTDVRDIVAIADLGESRRITPGNEHFVSPADTLDLKDICDLNVLPANRANTILEMLNNIPNGRFLQNINTSMAMLGLRTTRDYEKIRARRLAPSEYTFHPDLGFISLNTRLQPDHVVGIAFEYTYNGVQYQVGELSDLIPVDPEDPSVIYVKMLKSTNARVDLPIWDLMMKNFYRVGGGDVNPEEFVLDVFYEDPGAGFKRFLPDFTGVGNVPLITLFNLDNLNRTGDPQPDGRFDFVPGLTIYPREGIMMFPLLEPFGSSLEKILLASGTPQALIDSFAYNQLYDSTLIRAQEWPELNRFTIKGKSQSRSASDISLGTFNIPRGSVQVYAGGQRLQENVDYVIDYNIGRLTILNQSYVQPGTPIRVSFEDNALFSFQKKTMLGLRADYEVSKFSMSGAHLCTFSSAPLRRR
jgi:cell surface protein SprA